MVYAATCNHDFKQMVSLGDLHWLKCTGCYKVVESEFHIRGINNGTELEITGIINTNKTTVVIPSQIGISLRTNNNDLSYALPVTSIGENAFAGNANLKRITIDPSVRNIGAGAFEDCINLVAVTFGQNLISKQIETQAYTYNTYFDERALDISLEAGVTYKFSFAYWNLISSTSFANGTQALALVKRRLK